MRNIKHISNVLGCIMFYNNVIMSLPNVNKKYIFEYNFERD